MEEKDENENENIQNPQLNNDFEEKNEKINIISNNDKFLLCPYCEDEIPLFVPFIDKNLKASILFKCKKELKEKILNYENKRKEYIESKNENILNEINEEYKNNTNEIIYTIKDYMDLLKLKKLEFNNVKKKCFLHKNNENNVKFCIQCQKYFCEECQKKHKKFIDTPHTLCDFEINKYNYCFMHYKKDDEEEKNNENNNNKENINNINDNKNKENKDNILRNSKSFILGYNKNNNNNNSTVLNDNNNNETPGNTPLGNLSDINENNNNSDDDINTNEHDKSNSNSNSKSNNNSYYNSKSNNNINFNSKSNNKIEEEKKEDNNNKENENEEEKKENEEEDNEKDYRIKYFCKDCNKFLCKKCLTSNNSILFCKYRKKEHKNIIKIQDIYKLENQYLKDNGQNNLKFFMSRLQNLFLQNESNYHNMIQNSKEIDQRYKKFNEFKFKENQNSNNIIKEFIEYIYTTYEKSKYLKLSNSIKNLLNFSSLNNSINNEILDRNNPISNFFDTEFIIKFNQLNIYKAIKEYKHNEIKYLSKAKNNNNFFVINLNLDENLKNIIALMDDKGKLGNKIIKLKENVTCMCIINENYIVTGLENNEKKNKTCVLRLYNYKNDEFNMCDSILLKNNPVKFICETSENSFYTFDSSEIKEWIH